MKPGGRSQKREKKQPQKRRETAQRKPIEARNRIDGPHAQIDADLQVAGSTTRSLCVLDFSQGVLWMEDNDGDILLTGAQVAYQKRKREELSFYVDWT